MGSPGKLCPSCFPRWAGHGTHQSDCTNLGVTCCIPALPCVLCSRTAQPGLCLWGVHINPACTSLLEKGVTLPLVGVVRKLTGLAIQSLLVFRKECLVVPLYLCMGLQS